MSFLATLLCRSGGAAVAAAGRGRPQAPKADACASLWGGPPPTANAPVWMRDIQPRAPCMRRTDKGERPPPAPQSRGGKGEGVGGAAPSAAEDQEDP